nr:MAG TPA: hypothetical protein [Caudoviricetes sp.]DAU36186.1 MAG TPA: hypothetical protein [Caudoviricetes sp.]
MRSVCFSKTGKQISRRRNVKVWLKKLDFSFVKAKVYTFAGDFVTALCSMFRNSNLV